jgi:ribosomal protein L37E
MPAVRLKAMPGPRAPSGGDPWTSARERVRDDVRAVLAPRPRRCERCGHETVAVGSTCPSCGAPYATRARPPLGSRRARTGIAIAIGLVGLAAALTLPALDDAREEEAARADRERAAERERSRRAIERESVAVRGRARPPERPLAPAAEIAARRRLLGRLERAVHAEARERVRERRLRGPILEVRCSPYPRSVAGVGAEQQPARRFGRYECLAATARIPANEASVGGVLAHPFLARVDFRRFTWAFCKVSPPPGEKAIPAAAPSVPRACTG